MCLMYLEHLPNLAILRIAWLGVHFDFNAQAEQSILRA